MFSIKRKETLTRSMNDIDDAIFVAIRENFKSAFDLRRKLYFHLAHRSNV